MIGLRDRRPRPAPRWRSRWLWVAVHAALLLAVMAYALLAALRDPTDEASVDDAITRYRRGGEGKRR